MHIYRSDRPSVTIPAVPVHQHVLRHADTAAQRVAIIDVASGRQLTYGALATAIARVAGGLSARGFGRGSVMALVAANCAEYAILFHAASMAGGTVSTLNPSYRASEMTAQLEDSQTSLVVCDPSARDTVDAATAHMGVEVFVLSNEGPDSWLALWGDPLRPTPTIDPENDVAVVPYSSGTTGLPKGVMLSHRNLVANIEQFNSATGFGTASETVLGVLPLFHIYGMQLIMNATLAQANTLVLFRGFQLEEFLSAVEHHRVTRAFVVPPILLALAKSPATQQADLSSLRTLISGAAPLSAQLAGELQTVLSARVIQGFGMTETSPATHISVDACDAAAVGKLVPNMEMRIVDPATLRDLAPGGDGELWVRGPNIMKGYLGKPQETAEVLTPQGWLRTGDIGHVDGSGVLTITDRLKELIKYKGFQVAPAELEATIVTHPNVLDVAVVGLPDAEAGEIPKAFVVKRAGSALTADEVIDHARARLAHYKRVRLVEFVDAIPRSASGKILRRQLKV